MIYIAKNTFSKYAITFIKCNTWPFPNEVNGLFWRKAIDHSLTSGSTVPVANCGETRANVGRKTGRIDISVTDGWVINNGDKGGWISNSLALGDTSDTTSNNGGMGLKGKERCPDIEERDERCARCFSPNLKNSITVKIDKNAAAKAVLSFRDGWRHQN